MRASPAPVTTLRVPQTSRAGDLPRRYDGEMSHSPAEPPSNRGPNSDTPGTVPPGSVPPGSGPPGSGPSAERKIVPLFPLPDMVLFPGQVQPFHIFEPRYRQMVRDLLDSTGELVVGTVLGEDKGQLAEVAPVQEIAGLGRIEQYRPLPDGRFLVIILGLRRVLVAPIRGDHLYPTCEIEAIPFDQESIHDPIARARYEEKLRDALEGHWKDDDPLPEGLPLFQLTDLLQMHLTLSPEHRYQIFSTRPLEQRIEEVLAAARS